MITSYLGIGLLSVPLAVSYCGSIMFVIITLIIAVFNYIG